MSMHFQSFVRCMSGLFACCWLLVSLPSLSAADFEQPEPLEPEVAAASNEGIEAMAGIRIPEAWKIQLYAAEPDVANVVAFDIDNRGRLFACETFRQNRGVTDNRGHDEEWLMADLAAETVQDRIDYHKRLLGEAAVTYAQHDDRIRRLEDSDGDGRADQSYVLANGFNRLEEGTGAGVLVRGEDIYYTNIPKLWKLVDKNDDGHADERVVLADGFGVRVAFRGHDMHGLVMGPDGRIYFSIGDRGYHVTTQDGRLLADPASGAVFRCELDGSNLEVVARGLRNPQELAFNDLGDLFSVDNNSDSGDMARVVQILRGGDSGWRMYYQYLPDRGPFNRDRIWEPFHHEQPAYIVPPIANLTDGPSGLTYYPGTGFGDELNDTFLICDFRGGPANSGIRSFRLQPSGAFYALGKHSDPIWNVLATDVAFGPDGALYFSDWVNGWDGLGKGRVYRLTHPDHQSTAVVREVQQLLAGEWSGWTTEQLADYLTHADRRVRFESQWELARRGDIATLLAIATDTDAAMLTRLHAIWGADQVARLETSQREQVLQTLRDLLNDEQPNIRAAVARVAGERGDQQAIGSLRKLVQDVSPRVRYFATMALADLKVSDAFADVVKLLAENQNADPALRHAGVRYLSAAADAGKVGTLSEHQNEAVRRAAVVALRRMNSGELTRFLDDGSPLVVLEAARAIHDRPVPIAMKSLAEQIDESTSNHPEFLRRVLNANYRLGTPETANELGQFAGKTSAPVDLRIEALQMLADWANPDPRDRVLNDYRPLEPRAATAAAEALSPQIDSLMLSEQAVRETAINVASKLGIKKIVPMLVKRVADSKLGVEIRASALESLARLEPAQAVKLAREVKLQPANALLSAALKVLAEHDASNSVDRFVTATRSANTDVRQLAWDILADVDSPKAKAAILAAFDAYMNGKLDREVQLNVLEAAQGKLNDEQRAALLSRTAEITEKDPLGPWLTTLEGGDVERGRKLFFENTKLSCVRCHKVDRAGGEVGPELTTIAKEKDRRYLLEAICLPNAQVAKGFETAVVANDSGQVFTGIVKTESDDYLELIQNDGSQIRIPVEEIVARRKGQSSMPSDLVKLMSMRDLRDLVEYLASLKASQRGGDEVE